MPPEGGTLMGCRARQVLTPSLPPHPEPRRFRDETIEIVGAPGGIRTHDPRIRNPVLYPAELRALKKLITLFANPAPSGYAIHRRLAMLIAQVRQ